MVIRSLLATLIAAVSLPAVAQVGALVSVGGSSMTPGGSSGQLQINSAGAFGGVSLGDLTNNSGTLNVSGINGAPLSGLTGYLYANGTGLPTASSTIPGSALASGAALSNLGYTPAHVGANSDITALSGLTTPLSVAQGGTGAVSAGAALAALGAQAALGYAPAHSGANSDITALSGLTTALSIAQGGTGAASAGAALTALGAQSALGYTPAHAGANSDITALSGLTTALSVSEGGTGTTSATGTGTLVLQSGPTISSANFSGLNGLSGTAILRINGVYADYATAPTISAAGSLGTSPTMTYGGSPAGFMISAGSTGTTSGIFVLAMPAGTHGWACSLQDLTSNASITIAQTSYATNSATFQPYSRTTGAPATIGASDQIIGQCRGF